MHRPGARKSLCSFPLGNAPTASEINSPDIFFGFGAFGFKFAKSPSLPPLSFLTPSSSSSSSLEETLGDPDLHLPPRARVSRSLQCRGSSYRPRLATRPPRADLCSKNYRFFFFFFIGLLFPIYFFVILFFDCLWFRNELPFVAFWMLGSQVLENYEASDGFWGFNCIFGQLYFNYH